MAASRRMTVSGSTLRPGARQSISESWESWWRAWVDSMTVLYLPPNASVLADQKEVLTGWPSSPGPPPPCEKAVPPSTFWASSSQEVLVPRTHAQNCAYLIPTGLQFERPGGSMECSSKCCSPRGAESNLRPVLGLRRFSALDVRPGGPARVRGGFHPSRIKRVRTPASDRRTGGHPWRT